MTLFVIFLLLGSFVAGGLFGYKVKAYLIKKAQAAEDAVIKDLKAAGKLDK